MQVFSMCLVFIFTQLPSMPDIPPEIKERTSELKDSLTKDIKWGCQEDPYENEGFGGEHKMFNPAQDIKWDEFDFKMNAKIFYGAGIKWCFSWSGTKIIVWCEIARPTFWVPHSLVDVTPDMGCLSCLKFDLPEIDGYNTLKYQQVVSLYGQEEKQTFKGFHTHLVYLYPYETAGRILKQVIQQVENILNEVYCELVSLIPGIGPIIGEVSGFEIKWKLESFDGSIQNGSPDCDNKSGWHPFKPKVPVYASDYDPFWIEKPIDLSQFILIPGVWGDWTYLEAPEAYILNMVFPQVSENYNNFGLPFPLTLETFDCFLNTNPYLNDFRNIGIPGTNLTIGQALKYTLGCWGNLYPLNGIVPYINDAQAYLLTLGRGLYRWYEYAKLSPKGWNVIKKDWMKFQPYSPKKKEAIKVGHPYHQWAEGLFNELGPQKPYRQLAGIWWQKFKMRIWVIFKLSTDGGACSGATGDPQELQDQFNKVSPDLQSSLQIDQYLNPSNFNFSYFQNPSWHPAFQFLGQNP